MPWENSAATSPPAPARAISWLRMSEKKESAGVPPNSSG